MEILIKLLRQQITDYGKTNQVAAKKFQEMLEATIKEYNERRKFLPDEEAGATQEETAESIIQKATEQALKILQGIREDRESFRKLGLTFEEKAFYDILIHLRDKYNFVYGEDKTVDSIVINERCMSLARKVKKIIDEKSSFTDWLNNQLVRNQLKLDIKLCLVKNGYPPQYTPEVFKEVMGQVENFKKNDIAPTHTNKLHIDTNDSESNMPMAAEDIFIYGSIPVDLPKTNREKLIAEKLDLVLMYTIAPSGRSKTEAAGRIAIGIKEVLLKEEQMAAYKSVKYLLFHYWSNPQAYRLTSEPLLVEPDDVPSDYLKRMEKDAVKFLLLEYNPAKPADLGNIDILNIQRRETLKLRYLPFVTTIESIKK